ncbi:MAG: cytochrome c [Phenylobacterium sp.]
MRRLGLALLLLTAGCASLGAPARTGSVKSASVDRGLFFVLRGCAGCHAVEPSGMSPDLAAPPFAIIRLRHDTQSLEKLLAVISSEGHHQMPPIYMSAAEIRDVAAYIHTVVPVAPVEKIDVPHTKIVGVHWLNG